MPSPTITTGDVVWWKNGRYLVVSVTQNSAALCPIVLCPVPGHRADVKPSWFDAVYLRIDCEAAIRCVPFGVTCRSVEPAGYRASGEVVSRVRLAIGREVSARQFEETQCLSLLRAS
ncbi:hypothetical protein [Gluconobacter oxydans]|uniref:hypothetical protein n=1 Tax=Gluconobacter oxydans TaxID=442 RepID=UPI00062C4C76|nr:hypothetical protein [Gluconobacter oxydans]